MALIKQSMDAEKNGDIKAGLALLHEDFRLVDVWQGSGDQLLPSLTAQQARQTVVEVFPIKGREYHNVKYFADEAAQTVAFEFIETYPDPKTGQVYCTPQAGICEIKDGRIWRTRHYCDPRLSFMNLDPDDLTARLNS